ncbi:MAG: hypothetical protein MJZ41_05600 [Bacteroidaceae bacterium]|nr:hypothetical protein [Bacteroidaceae bacterium]
MKKIFAILSIALMSAFAAATASATTSNETMTVQNQQSLKLDIPVNLIVKQTIKFNDGNTITVYYQKEGDICRLYSEVDVTKYTEQDLNRIKSTTFEVTDKVKGKCLMTKKSSDIISMAKSVFGKL